MNWTEDNPPPPPQKSNLGLFLGIAVALFAVYLVVSVMRNTAKPPPENEGIKHPAVGKLVRGLEFVPVLEAANSLTDAELEGKVVLINFWGTWCPPCRVEFPHLAKLEQDFKKERDFQFVSVSVVSPRERDETKVKEPTASFLQEQGVKFPVYMDPDRNARRTLLAAAEVSPDEFGYPATVLLGRDGRICGFWIGYRPGWEIHMADTVRAALQPKVAPE